MEYIKRETSLIQKLRPESLSHFFCLKYQGRGVRSWMNKRKSRYTTHLRLTVLICTALILNVAVMAPKEQNVIHTLFLYMDRLISSLESCVLISCLGHNFNYSASSQWPLSPVLAVLCRSSTFSWGTCLLDIIFRAISTERLAYNLFKGSKRFERKMYSL